MKQYEHLFEEFRHDRVSRNVCLENYSDFEKLREIYPEYPLIRLEIEMPIKAHRLNIIKHTLDTAQHVLIAISWRGGRSIASVRQSLTKTLAGQSLLRRIDWRIQ